MVLILRIVLHSQVVRSSHFNGWNSPRWKADTSLNGWFQPCLMDDYQPRNFHVLKGWHQPFFEADHHPLREMIEIDWKSWVIFFYGPKRIKKLWNVFKSKKKYFTLMKVKKTLSNLCDEKMTNLFLGKFYKYYIYLSHTYARDSNMPNMAK